MIGYAPSAELARKTSRQLKNEESTKSMKQTKTLNYRHIIALDSVSFYLYHSQLIEEDDNDEDGAYKTHHEKIDWEEMAIDSATVGKLTVDHCSACPPPYVYTSHQGSDGHHVLSCNAIEEIHKRHSKQLQVICTTRQTTENTYHTGSHCHYPSRHRARLMQFLVEISRTYLMH